LGAAAVYRIVSGVAPLLIVPIALQQLGRATYGIWMTASGLTAFLAFADLGLGNTLMTRLGALRHVQDQQAIRTILGVTYQVVIGVSSLAVGFLILLWMTVPWDSWLHLARQPDAHTIVLICLLAFALNVPASIIVRVLFGLQRVGTSYLWQCTGPILSLFGAYLCHWAGASDELFVLIAVTGVLAGNLVCTFWWFVSHPHLRPTWAPFRWVDVSPIVSMGSLFLTLSIVMSVAMSVDVLLIPRHLGVAQVTDFSVPWRVFSQLGLVATLASLPMWPASAQALADGDISWVRSRIRKMVLLNLCLIGVPSLVAIAIGPWLLHFWLGAAIRTDRTLIVGFATWWCLMACMYPFFMVQNGAGKVRPQLIGWTAFLAASITIKSFYLQSAQSMTLLPLLSVSIYLVTVLPAAVVGYHQAMQPRDGQLERAI
jgi:O-antigen/teichoic acid export membrane protein